MLSRACPSTAGFPLEEANVDWLDQLNAQRRAERGEEEPSAPKTVAPKPFAIVTLCLLAVAHIGLIDWARNAVHEYRLAIMLHGIMLGFWIGVGRGPFWLRWASLGFLAIYCRLLDDPDPILFRNLHTRLHYSTLEIGLLVAFVAINSYIVPRVLGPSRKWSVPQFSIGRMLLGIGAVAFVCQMWRFALADISPDEKYWPGYAADVCTLLTVAVTVAVVASPLLYGEKRTRRKIYWRAFGAVITIPIAYAVLHWLFTGYGDADVPIGVITLIPIFVLLLYPMTYGTRGVGYPWIKRLDEPVDA